MAKYRKSPQRERILELLKHTRSHPTAEWIYGKLKKELPHLSLGTVYRNLRILEEQGEISTLTFGSSFDRFEGNTQPHYHFICTSCGTVMDLNLSIAEDLNRQANTASDATITSHRLEFYGICSECRKN